MQKKQPFDNIILMFKHLLHIIIAAFILMMGACATTPVKSPATANKAANTEQCARIKQASIRDNFSGIAHVISLIPFDIIILAGTPLAGAPPSDYPLSYSEWKSRNHPCNVELDRLLEKNENLLDAGKSLADISCYEEAMLIFDWIVKCYPESAEAHYERASILAIRTDNITWDKHKNIQKENRKKEAKLALETAIRLDKTLTNKACSDIDLESIRDTYFFNKLSCD